MSANDSSLKKYTLTHFITPEGELINIENQAKNEEQNPKFF
jgi:hypothetical protein